ncbi:MAG: M1 family aminopeptidase [Chitinophagaceae bacterium]
MKKILTLITVLVATASFAQMPLASKDDAWKKQYRAFETKSNNLVHTKLQAKFDYEKAQLNGKVWITLRPHFYSTKTLNLDAKGMDINSVEILKTGAKNIPLVYNYEDDLVLKIQLDKEYKANETYTVYIDYTAKPNEFASTGSAAIKDAKGLYFINPKGEEKDKPTQIWTQGETEATSVWVPTIDKPNQKTTQEFYLTVPSKYVTLSNGKLVSQTPNADKTRTDYWKMDLPHAPYLFFIGVGDFAVIKDTYKGKEVNYYVEKEYANAAKKIFGNTPEMMKFFSEKVTGVEYPWVKYSQITGRDYVSGAMENTTATLHQESAQQNLRELTDGNIWEGTIAHELFHQWFGDYVTAESWSNLTVNESFADYSQYLWQEYKYGADAAGEENDNEMQAYIRGNSSKKDLVRFYYRDKEDMFDLVSYQKGGRILNMLRNYIGDSAFFKSLNKYLTDNKFGTGSAHKLRLAFEAITGKDLNWFFNQWYFNSGHPKLSITNEYDATSKQINIIVKQTQDSTKLFKIPVAIDVYTGKEKTRHDVWIENKLDTIKIPSATAPDFVKFDADNVLLAEKKEKKTMQQYIIQYKQAGKYLDRKQALEYASKNKSEVGAMDLMITALKDPYHSLRKKALSVLQDTSVDVGVIKTIEGIANNDKNKTVRAEAIDFLVSLKNPQYLPMLNAATKDSSYSVAGAALDGLIELDANAALKLLPQLKVDAKGRLKAAIEKGEILTKTDADFEEMLKKYESVGLMEKFNGFGNFAFYLGRVNDTEKFKKGFDQLVKFRDMVAPYGQGIKEILNKGLLEIKKAKESQKAKANNANEIASQIDYITEQTKD